MCKERVKFVSAKIQHGPRCLLTQYSTERELEACGCLKIETGSLTKPNTYFGSGNPKQIALKAT
jgi:hypothetical protein